LAAHITLSCRGQSLCLAYATDAARHRARDVEREVRHFVDHEAEFAAVDDRDLAGALVNIN